MGIDDPDWDDYSGYTPLHNAAIKHGDAVVLKQLLAAGADPDRTNKYDQTPLHRAAEYDRTAAIKSLLAAGAALNLQDVNGYTALHCAIRMGHCASAALLLQHGAEVDIKDAAGASVFDIARDAADKPILALLAAVPAARPRQPPSLTD